MQTLRIYIQQQGTTTRRYIVLVKDALYEIEKSESGKKEPKYCGRVTGKYQASGRLLKNIPAELKNDVFTLIRNYQ